MNVTVPSSPSTKLLPPPALIVSAPLPPISTSAALLPVRVSPLPNSDAVVTTCERATPTHVTVAKSPTDTIAVIASAPLPPTAMLVLPVVVIVSLPPITFA